MLKPAIEKTYALLACTECGAEAYASCNCHKPYKPAKQRAADAIRVVNPHKSDRAIAKEIGVNQSTVSRARKATDADASVEPRTGLDGKTRKQPAKRKPAEQPAEPTFDISIMEGAVQVLCANIAAGGKMIDCITSSEWRDMLGHIDEFESTLADLRKLEAEKLGGEFGLVIIDTGPGFYEGDDGNKRQQ